MHKERHKVILVNGGTATLVKQVNQKGMVPDGNGSCIHLNGGDTRLPNVCLRFKNEDGICPFMLIPLHDAAKNSDRSALDVRCGNGSALKNAEPYSPKSLGITELLKVVSQQTIEFSDDVAAGHGSC